MRIREIVGTAYLFLQLAASLAFAETASPEVRYARALKVLSQCDCDFGIPDTPEDLNALDELWTAGQELTIQDLNVHPARPGTTTTLLALGLYGATADHGEIGDAFLASNRDGRFAVVWDARNLPRRDIAKYPVLAAWRTNSARDSCRARLPGAMWDRCGPVHATFASLPPDAQGRVRFYLHATYAEVAGSTVANQISFWSWDGRRATPLLVRIFDCELDGCDRSRRGDILTFRAKEEYRSFSSCGACSGREMVWRLRIDSARITDLGMEPVIPELDVIDELFQRIWKRMPTNDIARSMVIEKLQKIAKESQGISRLSDIELDSFESGSVLRAAHGSQVCLVVDAYADGLVFTLAGRNGHFSVTDVRQLKPREASPCH